MMVDVMRVDLFRKKGGDRYGYGGGEVNKCEVDDRISNMSQ